MSGNGAVTHQWYRNGSPVAGATANTLHFDEVTPENEGVYHVRLTDSTGTTTSRLVRVARAGVLEAWTGTEDNIPPSLVSRGVIHQTLAGTVVTALSTGPARLALLPGGSLTRIIPTAVSDTATPTVGGISPAISIQEAVIPPQIVNSDFVSAAVQNSRSSNGSPSSTLTIDGQKVLALRSDGSVVAWDASTFQLLPVPHSAQGSVAVSLSETEALSLKRDGSVVFWTLANGTLLTLPSGLDAGVTAISSGKDHHLALKADGSVIAWGDNSDAESTVPANLAPVRTISAGHDFSLALLHNGSVIAWGRNVEGQCDIPSGLTGVANLSAGEKLAIAVKSDGTAVAWGSSVASHVPLALSRVLTAGSTNRDGTAFGIAIRQTFAPVIQIADTSVICGQNEVVKLSSVVSAAPRATFQWQKSGVNIPGATQQNLSVRVSSTADLGSYRLIATNAAGTSTSEAILLSLDANGPVFETQPTDSSFLLGQRITLESSATASANAGTLSYQWYRNGRAIPAATASTHTIEAAALADAGEFHVRVNDASGSRRSRTARLRVRGSLRAWGFSSSVPGVSNDIIQTATGQYPIIALQSDGIVRTGGAFGVVPPPPEATQAVAVAANWLRFAVLREDGAVVEWATDASLSASFGMVTVGWNGSGYGPPTSVTHPSGSQIARIALGKRHTLALREDGTVTCWSAPGFTPSEANDSGQMSPPIGLIDVIAIAAGDSHSLALLEGGSVVAWGSSAYGQSTPPASVAADVIAIDARRDYSMALKADGSVVLWGRLATAPSATTINPTSSSGASSGAVLYLSPTYNYGPSFADTSSYLGPWTRSGSLGAVAISAGEGHALATMANGSVIAWGENSRHQCNIPSELAIASCIAAGGDRSAAIMPRSAPFITQQPQARRVFAGFSGMLFRVVASGVTPAGVQWQKNGVDIPNGIGFSLELTNISPEHGGTYRCILTNAEGSTKSDAVHLDVSSPLLFTEWRSQHFSNAQINAGLAAPTSAPDDSGVPNLLRYALGLSSSTTEHHRLPQLDLMNDTDGTCHGGLTFEVPQDVADVVFRLRVSENLQNWTTYSVTPILGPVVNGRRKVTLCDPNPATSQPRFYKLEVMQTTPAAAPAY